MKASAERSGGAGVTGKKGKDEDRIASDPSRAGSLGQVESKVVVCNAPTLVWPASGQKVLGRADGILKLCHVRVACCRL